MMRSFLAFIAVLLVVIVLTPSGEFVAAFAIPPPSFVGRRACGRLLLPRNAFSWLTHGIHQPCDQMARTCLLSIPTTAKEKEEAKTTLSSGRSGTAAHAPTAVDPLLTSILLQATSFGTASSVGFGGVLTASKGIQIWRSCLMQGRLPITADFDDVSSDSGSVWPSDPLFSRLVAVMSDLQLSRFVLRHPETVTAVLATLLRLIMDFVQQQQGQSFLSADDGDESTFDDLRIPVIQDDQIPLSDEEVEALAEEIAAGFIDEWGGVIRGVNALDQLFGTGHGLINADDNDDTTRRGFSMHDGIWQHSGWKTLPELQRQIANMPELRDLMRQLGRRPTSEQSDAIHKFAPQKLSPDGGLGAQHNPAVRDSVNGITLSNRLSEMLPTEAVLLRGSSVSLRRLFLAKLAESKLFSYEMSGWSGVPSIPRTRRRYRSRMPSAPGGPILVCLDTSWSMSGTRERLSKAVVVACVTAAHKQRRDCQIIAFSSFQNTIQAGDITADAAGVQRLLEFLSHSFGGGTDVTGALKHAMAKNNVEEDQFSAADVLLVTDGEIPDPPVPEEIMQDLDRLKQRTGMQVHGLLVGRNESKPLSKLCTETHDFLIRYDTVAASESSWSKNSASSSASALHFFRVRSQNSRRWSHWSFSPWIVERGTLPEHRRVGHIKRGHASLALHAKRTMFDDEGRGSRRRKRGRNNRRWDEVDDGLWEDNYATDPNEYERDDGDDDDKVVTSNEAESADSFTAFVDEATDTLRKAVISAMQEQVWKAVDLDIEKSAVGSCWQYRDQLQAAVDRIGEGLVEREQESRLVVLGMVAREHVLFLGPPGTSKSVLGRRLSQLCGGQFFQRLFTRFTTPEEIFGPLSLRALENDQYRRCTAGFLPTASVAFLDEIFKANSAILNTLLTILNERQYDNGAGLREECPIRCVVGASNELPESDELDALYDRFLLRKEVLPVSDDGLVRLLGMSHPGVSPCDKTHGVSSEAPCDVVFVDGLDRVIEALSVAADSVDIGDDACALMRDLRTFVRDKLDVDVSDRRLVKAARLLKVSAACHGRSRVDLLDCLLLQHMTWRLPEHRSVIRDWLWDHLTPGGATEHDPPSSAVAQFRLLLDGLRREALVIVRRTAGDVTGTSGGRVEDVAAIQSLRMEASRLTVLLQQRSADLARHMELLRRSMDHLWLDPNEARAVQQILLPRAKNISKEVDRAHADARALELALSEDDASPPNDLRLSVIEVLWSAEAAEVSFSPEAMSMSMKEAKAKYDSDTFRAWKRARKKASK